MAENLSIERLTPLDLLMPRVYIRALLVFETADPTSTVAQTLQQGLNRLSKQIPQLSGHVFPTVSAEGKVPTLVVRWDSSTRPTLIDKGLIASSYETLSAEGMSPAAIPEDVWPVPSAIDDTLFATGAPVFAASHFRFADGRGVGLCVCLHHNVVDATGFSDIVRLWAHNMEDEGLGGPEISQQRRNWLTEGLSSDLSVISSYSLASLFASHPEYSRTPPAFPAQFSPCMGKLFNLPVTHVNEIKELLRGCMPVAPTTNTLVCALIWSAITRARVQRNPALATETTRLVTAVNGRGRISATFSKENPYLGNVVLYSLAKIAVERLRTASLQESIHSLAEICNVITQSQSSNHIDSRYIAEVYSLADQMDDYKAIYPGWDLFNSRDLTITSWADLDLHETEFGPKLGRSEFIRLPCTEADGVAIILPRKRATATEGVSCEVIEVMIMLRSNDMAILEQDNIWKIRID